MRTELHSHELHSNFDYLSFYRRAYDFVLRIRNEVLFDDALQVTRRGDIHQVQNLSNEVLLSELFRGLKTKPKDMKVETTGGEVSKDVVPLDQLRRIAKVLEEVIHKEGSVELERAKMRLGRDWDSLKASYAADDFMQGDTVPVAPSAPAHEADQRPDGMSPPEHTDAANECEEPAGMQNVVEVIEEPTCLPVEPMSKASYTIVEAKDSVLDDFLDDFSPQLGSDSELEVVEDSTSEGAVVVKNPRGIYHRQNYSRRARRRHLVKVSSTSTFPRWSFPRRKTHRGVYMTSTRKRTIAFKCYVACSLARLWLGKKSKLQRRLQAAVKAVLAQGSCTLLDLQVAWHMAEPKVVDEEEMEWEEVWRFERFKR
jgi:hypothetical protein